MSQPTPFKSPWAVIDRKRYERLFDAERAADSSPLGNKRLKVEDDGGETEGLPPSNSSHDRKSAANVETVKPQVVSTNTRDASGVLGRRRRRGRDKEDEGVLCCVPLIPSKGISGIVNEPTVETNLGPTNSAADTADESTATSPPSRTRISTLDKPETAHPPIHTSEPGSNVKHENIKQQELPDSATYWKEIADERGERLHSLRQKHGEQLHALHENHTGQLDTLRQKNQELEDAKKVLEDEIQEANQFNEALEQSRTYWLEIARSLEEQLGSIREEVEAHPQEQTEHETRARELEPLQTDEKDLEDGKLTASVVYWKKLAEAWELELQNLGKEYAKQLESLLDDAIKNAQEELADKQREIENGKQDAQQKLADKQEEIDDLTWELNRFRRDNEDLNKQVNQLQRMMKVESFSNQARRKLNERSLAAQNLTLKLRNRILKKAKSRFEENKILLVEKINTLTAIVDNLDAENLALETVVDNLDEETRDLKSRLESSTLAWIRMRDTCGSVCDRMQDMRQDAKSAEDKMIVVHREVSEAFEAMRKQRDTLLARVRLLEDEGRAVLQELMDKREEDLRQFQELEDKTEEALKTLGLMAADSTNADGIQPPPRSETDQGAVLTGRVTKRTPSLIDRFRSYVGW